MTESGSETSIPAPPVAASRDFDRAVERRVVQLARDRALGLGELEPERAAHLASAYLPLCRWLDAIVREANRPLHGGPDRPSPLLVVGVNGAPGSGKTTFARLAELLLERIFHRRTLALSLDDLYLGLDDRERLAREVHPLLRTRGVPGTHDAELGLELIRRLRQLGREGAGERVESVALPVFDKAMDDRLGPGAWRRVEGAFDILLFEGWCVGIGPQDRAALATPINELERRHDRDGRWRRHVDERLRQEYARLYAELDRTIFLQVPGFEQVRTWRRRQEETRARRRPGAPALLDAPALGRFLAHYERLVHHALETLPATADAVCRLDADHRVVEVEIRQAGAPPAAEDSNGRERGSHQEARTGPRA